MTPFPSPQANNSTTPSADAPARGGFDSETFRSIQRRADEHLAQQVRDQAVINAASEHDQLTQQHALEMHAEASRLKASATRKAVIAGAVGFFGAYLFFGKK